MYLSRKPYNNRDKFTACFRIKDIFVEKEGHKCLKLSIWRRSGKSYLLFTIFMNYLKSQGVADDHIIAIELDTFENEKYRDPRTLLEYTKSQITDDGQYYIFLDEVQLLPAFESVLNSFLYIHNVDVYVTGSNSKFLSKDVITEFRGRGDEVHVYPVSFREYMEVFDGDKYSGIRHWLSYECIKNRSNI